MTHVIAFVTWNAPIGAAIVLASGVTATWRELVVVGALIVAANVLGFAEGRYKGR